MIEKAAGQQLDRERRDAERAAAIAQLRAGCTASRARVLHYVAPLNGLGPLESVTFAIVAGVGQAEKAALISQVISWAFEQHPPQDWDHRRTLEWEVERIIDQLVEGQLLLCEETDSGARQVMLTAAGVHVAVAHRIPVAGLRTLPAG